jgi:Ca2+-binding EF-hand superfamily protein
VAPAAQAAGSAVPGAASVPIPPPVEVVMPSVAAAEVKKALTTRALLPYYKLESVHQFMDIFAKVDENFSGDLDVNEWIKLFTSLNESVPVQEARMIFMKIDKDCDGYLTMRELVPVVFSKASKEQQRLIIAYAEMELTKKVEHENIPKVTNTDLEQLFESYDGENIGFVDVSLIKERVRAMNLSEQALFFFMDNISDLADDEMVNLIEFKRLFKMYTASR